MLSICSAVSGVYIISRVITREMVVENFRKYFLEKEYLFLYDLFTCFFCTSFWVSIGFSYYYDQNIFLIMTLANIINIVTRER